MLGNCEKHGTPYRVEEVREYPGKTRWICDACEEESRLVFSRFMRAAISAGAAFCTRNPGPLVLASLALLSSWMAQPATAAEPSPFRLRTEAWSLYVATNGQDAAPAFGTRIQPSLTFGRVTLAVRYDISRQKGEEGTVDLASFAASELYGFAAVRIVGPLSVCGVAGVSTPNPGQEGESRSMWMPCAMVGDGTGDSWLLVGYGINRAVSDDWWYRRRGLPPDNPGVLNKAEAMPMAAWRLKAYKESAFVGDAAYVAPWEDRTFPEYQIRIGIAVNVKLNLFGGGGK